LQNDQEHEQLANELIGACDAKQYKAKRLKLDKEIAEAKTGTNGACTGVRQLVSPNDKVNLPIVHSTGVQLQRVFSCESHALHNSHETRERHTFVAPCSVLAQLLVGVEVC